MESPATQALARIRREKLLKTGLAVVLAVCFALGLTLWGLWYYSSSHWDMTFLDIGKASVEQSTNEPHYFQSNDSAHQPDNERKLTYAQEIFGPNVRAGSLGPYSSGGVGPKPRFAYVFYATQKEYLCNVLINFDLLRRYEVAGEFALIYPTAWQRDHAVGSTSAIRQMLDKARDKYSANLHPVELWSTHQGDPTWSESLTKLYIFGMTNYTRLIYLDSDGLALNNLDHLFIAPQARIALPRAYWLDEPGKLASHIMVITPSNSMMHRIKEWANSGGTAIGFDMEVVNKLSASSSLILPHRRYAMLTGEFRNKDHSKYLAEEGPDAEWNPHAEMSASYYIHFSDWPLPKPWIKATVDQIRQAQPACDQHEKVKCWNRKHWQSVYELYHEQKDKVCIN